MPILFGMIDGKGVYVCKIIGKNGLMWTGCLVALGSLLPLMIKEVGIKLKARILHPPKEQGIPKSRFSWNFTKIDCLVLALFLLYWLIKIYKYIMVE